MHCLPCFQAQKSGNSFALRHDGLVSQASQELIDPETKKQNTRERIDQVAKDSTAAKTFTFRELATATRNFRQECLLGEGGFGRVFKGTLASNGQVVAVKQLDRSGMHGNKEFLGEIVTLSLLHHPNLVNLIGYCADGDQKLLVYEYMSAGSLENHLRDISPDQKPLDWFTRMRVALGIAKGLEYLHDQAIPPIIYRDLKPTNILLDEDYNPKLCDFGLAKLGPCGDPMCFPSRVVGSYGYCAPEYARSGQLTLKSDVYCFGVILLELITGRRALDTTRPMDEQNLVAWAQPIFKDPKRFPYMADPLLNKLFPEKDLNQAVAIAAMCLQEESAARPLMSDVVTALSFLSVATEESLSLLTAPSEEDAINDDDQQETKAGDSSGNEDNSSKSNDEHDNSRNEDKESEDHRNEDSEQEHDLYTSDRQDHDKSDCEEEDDVFIEAEDSADEHQQTDGGSKRWSQSRMKSINESVSASQKSSKKLGSRRVSPRHKSCIVTDDGSVSPGSQGSSEENALLRQKSSENSQKGFLSTKSSKNSTKASLNHISSKSSLFSLSHRSSRGSMEGSVSPSHLGSRRSQNDDSPFSRSSSGELMTEFDISSPWSGSKFQDGTASFDDGNSRGSNE